MKKSYLGLLAVEGLDTPLVSTTGEERGVRHGKIKSMNKLRTIGPLGTAQLSAPLYGRIP